ncbi:MAG TPA: TolC family protein [Geobacteraceae bacterium]
MKRYLMALVLVMACAGESSAQEGVRQLTLKEAIKMAVERNLDVQAELYNPASAEADIHKYQGIYNPLLTLLANYQDSSTLSANSFVSGGAPVIRQRSSTYNAGVSQLIPTGGTVGAAFNNSWNHNNFGSPGAINNYFQSNVTLSFSQPLLKNFGRENTELAINVARFSKEGSLEQFKSRLLDIISQVKTQYYQLYSLRENLEVKKTSLNLAETILNNTQAQVKAGVLPAMEILNAQFGVATQQKNLIDAERALRDQVDALRLLLQLNDVADIVPTDTPFRGNYPVDEAQEIKLALVSRPDLRQQRVTLKSNELQSRVARNLTLPELDFTGSAAFTGLANTYSRDLDRVGSTQYPIWIAGLQLTYPIGNDSAKNDYIKSRLKVDQSKTQVASLEESIAKDVRTAARAVRSGYLQLDVTAKGRAYAEEVLQAYIKKQKVGLATTKDVLDELNNLVTARGNEIQAVTDYNNAIVSLWRATGALLEREGITISGKEADSLYDKNR